MDQKALVEALARLLGRAGTELLERVVTGTLRFRLLRGRPSHDKLYLLSGAVGHRVLTGSANLSLAAFEGRQHEVNVASTVSTLGSCSMAIIGVTGRIACRLNPTR
jgi:hypothetical protein